MPYIIPDSELSIVSLDKSHNLFSFNCSSSELNDFLKNDALADQNDMISRTGLCFLNGELEPIRKVNNECCKDTVGHNKFGWIAHLIVCEKEGKKCPFI